VVVEAVSPNYDEFESVEEVELTEREKNHRLRLFLAGFTLFLIATMPMIQFYYADAFLYVLAGGIAFTIGTNLTIGILSIRIEDKAELMERRMGELLKELSTSTDLLGEFNDQLSQFPLESMLHTMESAREELGPALSQMNGVSWTEISSAFSAGMEWYETLDTDKIKSLMAPFIVETPQITLIDDPFNDDTVPEVPDFFPPPPPRHRN